ncbi:hypothetical protein GNI_094150, partial [Gregarina niphandrodes]
MNTTTSRSNLTDLVSTVSGDTVKQLFETSSTAHYDVSRLSDTFADFSPTVAGGATRETLRNISTTENSTVSSSGLWNLVSTVATDTMKRMFETSSTAHYDAPGLDYSPTDSVAPVTVNTTQEALHNTTEGESTTMSSSSLFDLVSTVTSTTMKRMFEASSTAHYVAPGLTDSVASVTVNTTKKALRNTTEGESTTMSSSSLLDLVSTVATDTMKRMFETSSSAHYDAPGLGYSSTDSVAPVT